MSVSKNIVLVSTINIFILVNLTYITISWILFFYFFFGRDESISPPLIDIEIALDTAAKSYMAVINIKHDLVPSKGWNPEYVLFYFLFSLFLYFILLFFIIKFLFA